MKPEQKQQYTKMNGVPQTWNGVPRGLISKIALEMMIDGSFIQMQNQQKVMGEKKREKYSKKYTRFHVIQKVASNKYDLLLNVGHFNIKCMATNLQKCTRAPRHTSTTTAAAAAGSQS